jgi:hypothetical protein
MFPGQGRVNVKRKSKEQEAHSSQGGAISEPSAQGAMRGDALRSLVFRGLGGLESTRSLRGDILGVIFLCKTTDFPNPLTPQGRPAIVHS